MQADTARRVNVETKYDFFWITDVKNRYGLLIKFQISLDGLEIESKLRGISVITIPEEKAGKLYLLLNNNKEWEIFFSVCTDLILMANQCHGEAQMIPVINQRIRRWQRFLSENNTASMPEILQMGLITELHFMFYSLIPAFGYKEAILSWVGPDSDKKDFSLANIFVEIKSFIASKGRIIKISSLHQLDNEVKPLYLSVYGLTRSDSGITVRDLISAINSVIPNEDYEMQESFENKLAAYGYIQSVTEPPFYEYSFDWQRSYLVSDTFPRISSESVDSRILAVQYSVDLTKCAANEVVLPFNI